MTLTQANLSHHTAYHERRLLHDERVLHVPAVRHARHDARRGHAVRLDRHRPLVRAPHHRPVRAPHARAALLGGGARFQHGAPRGRVGTEGGPRRPRYRSGDLRPGNDGPLHEQGGQELQTRCTGREAEDQGSVSATWLSGVDLAEGTVTI